MTFFANTQSPRTRDLFLTTVVILLNIGMSQVAEAWGGMAAPAPTATTTTTAYPTSGIPVVDATSVTLAVKTVYKVMHDGVNIPFWVYCQNGGSMGGSGDCPISGPTLQLGVGQTANIVLDMMMAPQEAAPYQGHTIHPHGLDVPQSEDGVPETGAKVLGDTYTFSVDNKHVGSHMYHCHVHTVKHLEMGLYGGVVVKDTNSAGALLNVINHGGPTYDYEWNMVLSTVDPAYHSNNAVGDSTVFADYNPKYFLVNGNEGISKTVPADSLTVATGKKVAIRLIGIHSVNAIFQIKDASGAAKSFTIYNDDGYALPKPITATSVEVTPGSTTDIMVTLPTTSGTWYPQITYQNLRNGGGYTNGTVYTSLVF
jgi:FtsP/CotA-like multicopper oxidase with cupredoxin domain